MIEFLQHILDEIKFLKNESAQVEFTEFINDEVRKRAFTRSLEIIGEATKQSHLQKCVVSAKVV